MSNLQLNQQSLDISPSLRSIGNNKSHQPGRLSDFQIIKKLGDGAYSSVYKIKKISDGNIYALK